MKVKTGVYTYDGYRWTEQHLDDAVQDLINTTPDGYVLSKLVEILTEKGLLNQDDLVSIFQYNREVEIIDKISFL